MQSQLDKMRIKDTEATRTIGMRRWSRQLTPTTPNQSQRSTLSHSYNNETNSDGDFSHLDSSSTINSLKPTIGYALLIFGIISLILLVLYLIISKLAGNCQKQQQPNQQQPNHGERQSINQRRRQPRQQQLQQDEEATMILGPISVTERLRIIRLLVRTQLFDGTEPQCNGTSTGTHSSSSCCGGNSRRNDSANYIASACSSSEEFEVNKNNVGHHTEEDSDEDSDSDEENNNNSIKGLECCICLEEFRKDDVVVVTGLCSHFCHCDCLMGWIKTQNSCPMCREQLFHEGTFEILKQEMLKQQQQQTVGRHRQMQEQDNQGDGQREHLSKREIATRTPTWNTVLDFNLSVLQSSRHVMAEANQQRTIEDR